VGALALGGPLGLDHLPEQVLADGGAEHGVRHLERPHLLSFHVDDV
jgi:hypothetical protein